MVALRRAKRLLRDERPKSPSSAWRSDWASRFETMLPLKQKLMVPRSSLTTTTTASVSSVMPSAARCREPNYLVQGSRRATCLINHIEGTIEGFDRRRRPDDPGGTQLFCHFEPFFDKIAGGCFSTPGHGQLKSQ